MDVNGMQIEILPHSGSVKYLGRKLTFDEPDETEFDNIISIDWKKFMIFKEDLTSKVYSLHDRLKLFEAVVKPTVVWVGHVDDDDIHGSQIMEVSTTHASHDPGAPEAAYRSGSSCRW